MDVSKHIHMDGLLLFSLLLSDLELMSDGCCYRVGAKGFSLMTQG